MKSARKILTQMMYKCLVLLTVLAVQQTVTSTTSDSDGDNECVSQQQMADMQGRVDTLQSQLDYWQNVTINILKKLYFSPNSVSDGDCQVGDTNMESRILNNITETICIKHVETNEQLESLKSSVDQLQVCVKHVETNERLERLQSSVDQLQGAVEQLEEDGCNAMTESFHNPAHNCSHIVYNNPNATSGYYWLQSGPSYFVKVYCDMERVCGCDEGRRGRGGWMRVADINMTREKDNCPIVFREVTSYGKRMCGGRGEGCDSTRFSSHGIEYSRVCGRIIGYQFGWVDAFLNYYNNRSVSIDSYFLDGIVLTYGSPRSHIWSFAVGYSQYNTETNVCPCNPGSFPGTIPPYIQNDYFCDSGNPSINEPSRIHYVNDPLWDGVGCDRGSCCQFNSPPWFCKDLPHPTSEDIELRLCLNEASDDEDVPFEVVEIYIQ